MGLRFASLGSGSRGNAALIQSDDTLLLLDAGFPARELVARCASLGIDPTAIDAILVTHEHGDHVRGVGPMARRFKMPVWMSHGTWRGSACGELPRLELFDGHGSTLRIGDIEIEPFTVPHDACEPTQFVFSCRGLRFGVLTDLGSLTPHVLSSLDGVDALLLECNHDREMLRTGPYPPSLQARVGGDYGHLSNDQSAELLSCIDHQRLRHLLLGHLSEKNNHPQLAQDAVLGVAPSLGDRLALLTQGGPSGWHHLD